MTKTLPAVAYNQQSSDNLDIIAEAADSIDDQALDRRLVKDDSENFSVRICVELRGRAQVVLGDGLPPSLLQICPELSQLGECIHWISFLRKECVTITVK